MSGKVYSALAEDAKLRTLGVKEGSVFPDYTMEEAPRDGIFLILRWGSRDSFRTLERGPTTLTVWAHQPEEWGSDYTDLIRILQRVHAILKAIPPGAGEDDLEVTNVSLMGVSGNLVDPGFGTITKNSSYSVLLRSVV